MTEPCDLSACDARALIGRRALSPVDLVRSCIARIEAVDHAVNAMPALDFDRALDAARAAEEAVMRGLPLGALHGLPVGVKDLQDTAGLRTTYGNSMFRDHVPQRDAAIVARLRGAGAIILGKTNTPEWGAGANTRNAVYGATGNPFDPVRSAAGSSGGSAAALACGMVPLATGSDTGGSLRNPAAFCGVVGFRPSPGLVPYPARTLGWSVLQVLGPMARDVGDLCLMLSAMVADDAGDPLATTVRSAQIRRPGDFSPPPAVDLATVRAAWTADFGFAPVERVVAATFAAKTAPWRGLFTAAEDATPDCTDTDEVFEVLRALSALAQHGARVRAHPGEIGPNIHADVAAGLRLTGEEIARAMAAQTRLYHRWQDFFTRHDVIVTPSITITPRPWSELYPSTIDGQATRSYFHWLALAYAVSVVGHPAVSVPLGLDAHGMPFGVQIVGPRGGDAHVLGVAAALGAERPVPDIERLRAAPPIAGMPGFLGYG